jgi:hypothetical protein
MFRIEILTLATVTDDGTDFEGYGGVHWDENSYAECANCCAHGRLSRFMAEPPAPVHPPAEPEPPRAELLRFLTEFVAFGYDPSGRDHWDGMSQFLEHARILLRQAKGRRAA